MSCPCFSTTMGLVVSLLVWIVLQILRLMEVERYHIKVRLIQEPESGCGSLRILLKQRKPEKQYKNKINQSIITISRPNYLVSLNNHRNRKPDLFLTFSKSLFYPLTLCLTSRFVLPPRTNCLQSVLKLLRDFKYFLVKFYKDDVTYQGAPRGLRYRETKMME